jgi:VanZ family protein
MATIRRTLLPLAATALLLSLTLMPSSWIPRGEEGPRPIPHLDKVVHFVMFAGFALSWVLAGRSPRPSPTRVAAVLAAGFALAIGTELVQGLPQVARDPDPLDALADTAGTVAGVGLIAALGVGRGSAPLGDEADGR